MANQKPVRSSNQSRVPMLVRSFALVASLAAIACGSGDDPGSQPGTETEGVEAWTEYCTATFTEEYDVKRADGDYLFTAQPGDKFLVAGAPHDFIDENIIELHYLTPIGPWDFEVSAPLDQDFPLTMTCDFDKEVVRHHAVFADIDVYTSEDLSEKVCQLNAHTAVPEGGSTQFKSGLHPSGKYELSLGALGTVCGTNTGYVAAGETELFGSIATVSPINVVYSQKK